MLIHVLLQACPLKYHINCKYYSELEILFVPSIYYIYTLAEITIIYCNTQ